MRISARRGAFAPLCLSLAGALALAGGCDSGTADERSGEEPPPPAEVDDDVVDEEKCTDPGAICPVGHTCNESTGKCEVPRCDPACEGGQRCDAATRTCVDPNPCESLSCDAGQKCYAYAPDAIPDSGERATCIPNCSINPAGDPVRCEGERTCNTSNGLCDCGGSPCPGDVGTACNNNDDCLGSGANRRCLGIYDGGYCSSECSDSECPAGSACVDIGEFVCMDLCAQHSDCREGYRCLSLQEFDECNTEGKVCIPESTRSDCTGPDCAISGEACEDSDECFEGAFCATGWPDGTCIIEGCDPQADGRACPDGSDCVEGVFSTPNCMMGCDTFTKDCRPGYWCVVSNPRDSTGGCIPRSCDFDSDCAGEVVRNCDGDIIRRTPDELCDVVIGSCDRPCRNDFDCGAPCLDMDDEDCDVDREGVGLGRRCDHETERCFTPCEDDEICGLHGYCDFDSGRCVPACELDSECPPGSTCSSDGRCKPPCVDDAGCSGDQYCDIGTGECIDPCQDDRDCPEGLECRRRIERCVRPLDQIPVGDACTRHDECRDDAGGECLRNRDGFPGGYCTARECSELEECPRSTVCRMANLPGANGLIPACFESCERRADCRESYDCLEGVCQPEGLSIVAPPADPDPDPPEGGEGEGEAVGEGEGEPAPAVGEGEGEPDNG